MNNRLQHLKTILETYNIGVQIKSEHGEYNDSKITVPVALKLTRHKNSPDSLPSFKVLRELNV